MLPKPIAYTTKEGGDWQRWRDWVYVGAPPNPPLVHSVMFEDGTMFDTFNGWRAESRPEQALYLVRKYRNEDAQACATETPDA
jgi:hypothetical protein